MERVVLNALALGAAGSPPDISAFGDPPLRIVDIGTPEFSLALRHSSGRCRCKLWPQNENLIVENDFNARGNQRYPDRAKSSLGRERARRDTFITSGMATLMAEAR
jgi:hypothetical protein